MKINIFNNSMLNLLKSQFSIRIHSVSFLISASKNYSILIYNRVNQAKITDIE